MRKITPLKPKPKKISALQYPAYGKFVDQRDRAAEKILQNFNIEQSDILRKYFKLMLDRLSSFILQGLTDIKTIEQAIEGILKPAVNELTDLSQDLRKKAFVLSLVGEAEAIGRITGKAKYDASHELVAKHLQSESMAGGKVRDRIGLYFDRLRHDVVDALQIGLIKKDKPQDLFKRVIKALPKVKRQRVVRALSKIKESKKDFPDNLSPGDIPDKDQPEDDTQAYDIATGFVDDTEWNGIVDSYTDAYIPESRGPEFQIDPDEPGWPSDEKVYATDIEREMTEDFVKSVRDGQVEAANQNGIDDFMWIAVLDDKTCDDCCAPRDGMTSSEIEKAIEDGDLDECDDIVPPAHCQCRCRLAPMVDSDQEPADVDTDSFDDWADN